LAGDPLKKVAMLTKTGMQQLRLIVCHASQEFERVYRKY